MANVNKTDGPPHFTSYYTYPKLSKYEGLVGKIECRAPTTFVGIEVELEGIKTKEITTIPSSFKMEPDGSLKLNGMEFISVPIRFIYLEEELKRLFGAVKNPTISSRCSIHVHLNARDFSEEELYRFMILYLIFERSLFRFSGSRNENIFCHPVYSYLGKLKDEINKLKTVGNIAYVLWNKYIALNLCPLWGGDGGASRKIGTIEFRHMAGTTDVERIIHWINLIVSLKISAKKFKLPKITELVSNMTEEAHYHWLAEQVFKDWVDLLDTPEFASDVAEGILAAKLVLFDQDVEAKPVRIQINKKGGVLCAA